MGLIVQEIKICCYCNSNFSWLTNINWEIPFSALIVIAGWFAVHYFAKQRDVENKRREIALEYMVNTYRILANEILQRQPLSADAKRLLENALSDLQLFGTVEQVEMAKNLANEIANNGQTDLSPLINSLRDSLRRELKLKDVNGNIQWLRLD